MWRCVDTNIFELQISVDNALIVQVLDGQNELCRVELCHFVGKVLEPRVLVLGQVEVQVAPCTKIQHKEELPVVLECVMHPGDEGVI